MTRRRYAMDGTLLSGPPETPEELEARRLRFAEMIRERKFPQIKTDTSTWSGLSGFAQNYENDPIGLYDVVKGARAHGYEPKSSDLYNPTIARFPGDPDAFFQPREGTAHLKKVAEKRGVPLRGAINYDPPVQDSAPAPVYGKLAPDIVNRHLEARAQQEPEIRTDKRKRQKVREEIVAQHAFTP